MDIPAYRQERRKAAKIPMPPPLGVGIKWELRPFGWSRKPNLRPNLIITQAPTIPEIKPVKYSPGSVNFFSFGS